MDSLHKIHSMLETLKRAIGYTDFGSEFSFNEATVACFSHYANLFHDANSEEVKRNQSCTAFCEYCQWNGATRYWLGGKVQDSSQCISKEK